MTRDERQKTSINKYRNTSINTGVCKGTIVACTGFGKTKVGIDIKDLMVSKRGTFKYYIIVPSSDLKTQWEEKLNDLEHSEVITIQKITQNIDYYLKNKLKGFFVIIDEIHRFASESFYQIFNIIDNIDRTNILGLTGTWNRADGKEELISIHCPIIDTITIEEARRNGWVSDFTEYCWGIELSEKDKKEYNDLNELIESYFAYFNHDYNIMFGCCSKKDRIIKGVQFKGSETFINENPDLLIYYEDKYGNPIEAISHYDKITALTTKANVCKELITKRKEFTDFAPSKIEAVLQAIHYFKNKKVIVFGGNDTKVIDEITDRAGKFVRSYHSNLETIMLPSPITGKLIKTSGKKQCELNLQDFKDNKFSILNTARKADEGLDVVGVNVGIVWSRVSNPGNNDQRRGRIVRKEGDKEAIFLHIYIKGTKDENNLKWITRNVTKVRWIKSLNEVEL